MATSLKQDRYPDSPNPKSVDHGLAYQDHVRRLLIREVGLALVIYDSSKFQLTTGESFQSVEIKLDRRCTETRRLSIEIAEKSREALPSFTPSGIYSGSKSTFYWQGGESAGFLFERKRLVEYHIQHEPDEYTMPTIRKFYIPLDWCFQHALYSFKAKNPYQYELFKKEPEDFRFLSK